MIANLAVHGPPAKGVISIFVAGERTERAVKVRVKQFAFD